ASIRCRRAGCLDRPPPAAPHRRCDGAPASPLRYSARARTARLSSARGDPAGDGLSSLHLPRRDEGARRVGPPLRRLEPAPAAGARRRRGLVWCPRDGFTASVDPGPAAGVLAPPSLLRPRREAPRAFATPRPSSLRSPASVPGHALATSHLADTTLGVPYALLAIGCPIG